MARILTPTPTTPPSWTARGGCSGDAEFPATAAGYAALLGWLRGFGRVTVVGVEGTGSYGAGLTRHLTAKKVSVACQLMHPLN